MNKFLLLGAIFALFAVIIGAFGAHGLEQMQISEKMLARFDTGVKYQFYHAFGIIIIGLLITKNNNSRLLSSAGISFSLGIILFSGSLYSYVLTANKLFGMITPIGGLAFILGWILLTLFAYKNKE
jgi:uncharacterized membrane protein YgdD (TMEM256/DUF423 family)